MEPFLFKDTFGGYLFGASIISVLLAFHVYRDRYPLFSAISLLSFAAGLLFSSHWLLIRSPGDSLDRVLTKPIGVVLLLASFAVLAWGYRRLRALPDRRPRPERGGDDGDTRSSVRWELGSPTWRATSHSLGRHIAYYRSVLCTHRSWSNFRRSLAYQEAELRDPCKRSMHSCIDPHCRCSGALRGPSGAFCAPVACSVASGAKARARGLNCGLTPRSTGPAAASCHCVPVSSNVGQLHTKTIQEEELCLGYT